MVVLLQCSEGLGVQSYGRNLGGDGDGTYLYSPLMGGNGFTNNETGDGEGIGFGYGTPQTGDGFGFGEGYGNGDGGISDCIPPFFCW